MTLYPQKKFHPATPLSDKMILLIPTLKVQSILSLLQIPDQHAIEPTQTMMQLLWKQIELTQTLIGCLSRMLMPHFLRTLTNLI